MGESGGQRSRESGASWPTFKKRFQGGVAWFHIVSHQPPPPVVPPASSVSLYGDVPDPGDCGTLIWLFLWGRGSRAKGAAIPPKKRSLMILLVQHCYAGLEGPKYLLRRYNWISRVSST